MVEVGTELPYYVAFSVFPGIGPVRFKLLTEYFGSARSAWEAPVQTLKAIGLNEKLIASFTDFRKTFHIQTYLEKLVALHVSVLPITDARYPALLKEIPDAPFVLYVLGKRTENSIDLTRTIGVVGTRNITPYGKEVTETLVTDLVAAGCTIVSGMAYGIDAAAHWASIRSSGKTIAVLGCGIDIIAPPSNANLYHAIAEGAGAIVSEMPLGLRPNKGLFPARNRIISGLCRGIVVTEGADDSGALITARNALEQGRDVFAVPGPITSAYSRGPAKLLKQGAKLVESANDILEEFGWLSNQPGTSTARGIKPVGDNKQEDLILTLLYEGQRYIDDMVRATHLTMEVVAATLTVLEVKGKVKDYGGKMYGLVSREKT